MDLKQFRSVLESLYKKREEKLEALSYNFCPNLTRPMLAADLKRFTSLTSLSCLNVEFSFSDLKALLASGAISLKSVAFSLKEKEKDHSSWKSSTALSSFGTIEQVKIGFGPSIGHSILDILATHFQRLESLEIYYINRSNALDKWYFSDEQVETAKSKLCHLKELVLSDGILLQAGAWSPKLQLLVDCFDFYHFNLNFMRLTLNLMQSLNGIKFSCLRLNLETVKRLVTTIEPGRDTFWNETCSGLLSDELRKLSLYAPEDFCCAFEEISVDLARCQNLTSLDLQSVHIHSTNSFCELLSNLKSNLVFFILIFSNNAALLFRAAKPKSSAYIRIQSGVVLATNFEAKVILTQDRSKSKFEYGVSTRAS